MGVDEQNPKLKLYIRLPVKIKDKAQVEDLHPDIKQVTLPRQAGRWCVVSFPDKETLWAVKAQLKGKKIDGKNIYFGPVKKSKAKSKPKAQKEPVKSESLLELIK